MPSVMLSSFDDVVSLFSRNGAPVRADRERQQLVIAPPKDVPGEMVVLWDARHALVQCLLVFPYRVQPEQVSEVVDAIVRINHALLLPGFGFDHSAGLVYFRIVAPRNEDGTMSEAELTRIVGAVLTSARDYGSLVQQVATGSLAADQVLTRAASAH